MGIDAKLKLDEDLGLASSLASLEGASAFLNENPVELAGFSGVEAVEIPEAFEESSVSLDFLNAKPLEEAALGLLRDLLPPKEKPDEAGFFALPFSSSVSGLQDEWSTSSIPMPHSGQSPPASGVAAVAAGLAGLSFALLPNAKGVLEAVVVEVDFKAEKEEEADDVEEDPNVEPPTFPNADLEVEAKSFSLSSFSWSFFPSDNDELEVFPPNLMLLEEAGFFALPLSSSASSALQEE